MDPHFGYGDVQLSDLVTNNSPFVSIYVSETWAMTWVTTTVTFLHST